MGLLVLVTATLGVIVGAVVSTQTLFNITQDHLANYATLLAVGFSSRQIMACVLLQGLFLSGGGVILGGAGFLAASILSSQTPVPLEMTPAVFAGLVVVAIAAPLLGSFLSVKPILRIDPSVVFRV
jgi:putative ABC transport system permease protein